MTHIGNTISSTLHITEHHGDIEAGFAVSNIDEVQRLHINLNLGHLARTGKYYEDPAYNRLSELSYKATHDPLTGLYNRDGLRMMFDRVTTARADNPNSRFAMVLLDFDGFKQINDTMGHQVGDDLIESVAKTWTSSLEVREDDVIARIGGDEFAIFADTSEKGNKRRGKLTAAQAVAGIIGRAKHDAVEAGKNLGLNFKGVSAGHAQYQKGMTLDQLIKVADAKLYKDKAIRKEQ